MIPGQFKEINNLKRFIVFSLFFFASTFASSSEKLSRLEQLQNDKTWQLLLHYKPTNSGGLESQVNSPDFFLSSDGKYSPLAELRATVEGFQQKYNKKELKPHPQCRFPARLLWLTKVAPTMVANLPNVECPNYRDWQQPENTESISLIFASGFLGNPASFYGHLLLKLNDKNQTSKTELLDTSVNFGATTPDDENPVVYIVKGLLGGYQATYSHQHFYRHNHSYGETELRDLWEYKLDIPNEIKSLIVAHLWELIGKNFTYYFIDENCAYFFSELLALALGEPLLPQAKPWAMPIDVFRAAVNKSLDGRPFIKEISYLPSRQTRFKEKYQQLDVRAKRVVHAWVDEQQVPREYDELDDEQQVGVLDTLFDYLESRLISAPSNAELKSLKRKVLLARFKLPAQKLDWTFEKPLPPHKGQAPSLLGIDNFYNEQLGWGQSLRFRLAYFDHLSNETSRLEDSSLTMFDTRVSVHDGEVWLRELTLLGLESLNVSETGLKGDGGYAWSLFSGFKTNHLSCSSCLVPYVKGGLGKATRFYQATLFGFTELNWQENIFDQGNLQASIRTGLISDITDWWRLQLTTQYEVSLDANHSQFGYKLESRFTQGIDWDIRLKIERDQELQYTLSYGLYW